MEHLLAWALTTLISAFVGSYLAGYLKKKGENLATHEDIDKLVDQVRAVTQTTKEIEAKIDDQVWNRQRRWELRRDVLFEASRRLAQVDDALLYVDTTGRYPKRDSDPNWLEAMVNAQRDWRKATSALDESRFFVGVVCEKETIDAIDSFGRFTNKIAGELSKKNLNAYLDSAVELAEHLYAARRAIRKELGIDSPFTSQSNVSSATQGPD